jgi:hypothetical protein
MNSKLLVLIAGLAILCSYIPAQPTQLKCPSVCKPFYPKYLLGSIILSESLDCYNSNGFQPCFLFGCSEFPDSVDVLEVPDNYLAGGSKYIISGNTVMITNKSGSHIQDMYYYSRNGLLDSAILESEADGEYDEYAIKHIYTYKNNLPDTDMVYVDNIDDSVNNDWEKRYFYKTDYKNNRLSEASIYFLNSEGQFDKWQETTYTYSDSSSKGYTRTDSMSNYYDFKVWQPKEITIHHFNSNNQCDWIKKYAYPYTGYPDSIGKLEYLYRIDNTYNNSGIISSSIETINNSAQPSKTKYVFEENTDKNQKSISIYGYYEKDWHISYQYTSYYSKSTTKTSYAENQDIKLYPNPTSDYIKMEGIADETEVSIYSTDGKIISTKICYNNSISMQEIPVGMYILKLRLKNNVTLNRLFIKQ